MNAQEDYLDDVEESVEEEEEEEEENEDDDQEGLARMVSAFVSLQIFCFYLFICTVMFTNDVSSIQMNCYQ